MKVYMPSIKSLSKISLREMQLHYIDNPKTENMLIGSELILEDGSSLYGESLIHRCCILLKNYANTNLNFQYTNMQMKKIALENLIKFEREIKFDFPAFNFNLILGKEPVEKSVELIPEEDLLVTVSEFPTESVNEQDSMEIVQTFIGESPETEQLVSIEPVIEKPVVKLSKPLKSLGKKVNAKTAKTTM